MFLFSLGLYLGVGLLGHMLNLYLPYCETARLLSKGTGPFHISTTSVEGFYFFHILTYSYIYLFDHSHPSEFEVTSHLGFTLHFFYDKQH